MLRNDARLFLALAAVLWTVAAHAEPVCGPRQSIVAILIGHFGEEIVEQVEKDGALAEFWGNPRTGTYTFASTDTSTGVMCIHQSGEGWEPGQGV